MIAKVVGCAAPGEAPAAFQASGGFRAQWALILAGGSAGARVLRVRAAGCLSSDPEWALREIRATQALAGGRSRGARTYRLVVAFHLGERPGPDVLDDVEEALVAAAGLAGHQRLSALHDDGARWWLQIAVSKVHPATFRTVTPFYDRRRLMAACGALEAKHGLAPDHHRGGAAWERARPGCGGGRCS